MNATRLPRLRQGALAATAALILTLAAACGDDDSGGNGSDAASGPLSEQEREQLEERLIQLANEQTQQSGSVSGGGYGYTSADQVVIGFASGWQTNLERCQAVADAIGELDGPPGTVPITIMEYRNDGTGASDVLASGRGGGTCEET